MAHCFGGIVGAQARPTASRALEGPRLPDTACLRQTGPLLSEGTPEPVAHFRASVEIRNRTRTPVIPTKTIDPSLRRPAPKPIVWLRQPPGEAGDSMTAMTVQSTRRDPRYELRSGSSFVEFSDPELAREHGPAELVRISIAGLAFRMQREPNLAVGTVIRGVTIRVGECHIEGELVVRSIDVSNEQMTEVGCLFYPRGRGMPERLMALISGIEAVLAHR